MANDFLDNVEKVKNWVAPIEDGAPLLTMPNIPKPLFNRCPRTIEGQSRWNLMRTKCYMDADYTCQVCGKYLGAGHCDSHELFSIDWAHQRSKFERCVCLCQACHQTIHSGRLLTMYNNKEPYYNAQKLTALVKRMFELISDYNNTHENKLKVYGTIIGWLQYPELAKWIQPMIEHYNINFYTPYKSFESFRHWSSWRLEYNGKLYEPLYATPKEWADSLKGK